MNKLSDILAKFADPRLSDLLAGVTESYTDAVEFINQIVSSKENPETGKQIDDLAFNVIKELKKDIDNGTLNTKELLDARLDELLKIYSKKEKSHSEDLNNSAPFTDFLIKSIEMEEAIPTKTFTKTVEVQWCPHCDEEIHEKSLYFEDNKFYHRPCLEKGPIDEIDPNNIELPNFESKEGFSDRPTQAMLDAGNYKKKHIKFGGMDIAIENEKGSTRSGIDRDGKEWSIKMNHDYGYIKGTKGADKDHVDVFMSGPDRGKTVAPEQLPIFVINQVDPKTGEFDEHKCMLGFQSEKEAKDAYLSNYEKDWNGLGSIKEMNLDEFKKWVFKGKKLNVAEHLLKVLEQYTSNVPVNTIRVYLKSFFLKASEDEKKYWSRLAINRFPDVNPAILVDIKDDIVKEIASEQ